MIKNVVIIGGGLSGYLLLITLLRFHRYGEIRVVMMEKEAVDRLGVPYSTENEDHLLNVPAGNMSAFSDEKRHFTEWLYSQSYTYSATSFVPRKIYRQYILDIFDRLMEDKSSGIEIIRMRAEVVDIDMENKKVLSREGIYVPFDQIIMATGTFAADHLPLEDKTYMQTAGYFHSAWDVAFLNSLEGNEKIFIIGTGLTMTDTLISLYKAGHRGEITALSKHGLIPTVHKKCPPYPDFWSELRIQKTALGMLRIVKWHLRKAAQTGVDWRAVIDAIRPYTPQLWKQLPDPEKKIFMEHLRHRWDVCRHRMPDSSAGILSACLSEKKVKVLAGRILEIKVMDDGCFAIGIREHVTHNIKEETADVIVNCMGPATNYNRIPQVLIRNLLEKGLICTDLLCLGVLCNEDGALIQKDGAVSDCFYTLGAPAKGILWETTAVPEIRVQAHRLAHKILGVEKEVFNFQTNII